MVLMLGRKYTRSFRGEWRMENDKKKKRKEKGCVVVGKVTFLFYF